MVRHKTRWMLVRLDGLLMKTNASTCTPNNNKEISKKDLASAIRDTISTTLGLAGEGAARETQVRLWDPLTCLLLIRVPRTEYAQIRASLTVWTQWGSRRIVASVLGVHGSARTAKRGTLLYLHKLWIKQQQQQQQQNVKAGSNHPYLTEQELKRLQFLVSTIQAID